MPFAASLGFPDRENVADVLLPISVGVALRLSLHRRGGVALLCTPPSIAWSVLPTLGATVLWFFQALLDVPRDCKRCAVQFDRGKYPSLSYRTCQRQDRVVGMQSSKK